MTEYGEVLITRRIDDATGSFRIHIDRADLRCRIGQDLLTQISDSRHCPWATLADNELTLADDDGQRFVYRIRWADFDAKSRSFGMERDGRADKDTA